MERERFRLTLPTQIHAAGLGLQPATISSQLPISSGITARPPRDHDVKFKEKESNYFGFDSSYCVVETERDSERVTTSKFSMMIQTLSPVRPRQTHI